MAMPLWGTPGAFHQGIGRECGRAPAARCFIQGARSAREGNLSGVACSSGIRQEYELLKSQMKL
jgi:hypothetical protein